MFEAIRASAFRVYVGCGRGGRFNDAEASACKGVSKMFHKSTRLFKVGFNIGTREVKFEVQLDGQVGVVEDDSEH